MSETLFRGVIFGVERFDAELPDGRKVKREVVRHPGAAVVLPVLPDGRLLLVRVLREIFGRYLIEAPAGKLEEGEDPKEAALRELEEETGYYAHSIEKLLEFYATPGFCDERMHVYLATELEEREQDLDDTEYVDPFPVTLDQALSLIREGEIEDGKTIAAVLYYAANSARAASPVPEE